MVPARPFFMGSDGWVRSNACTWLFSSRHSTTAFSGGFRYSPTTSTSFSSNRGSVDNLNVSTRCGCSPRARQTRCTVSRLTPTPRRHRPRGPVRRPRRGLVQRHPHDLVHRLRRNRGLTPPALTHLGEPGQPLLGEPSPPPAHRHRRH